MRGRKLGAAGYVHPTSQSWRLPRCQGARCCSSREPTGRVGPGPGAMESVPGAGGAGLLVARCLHPRREQIGDHKDAGRDRGGRLPGMQGPGAGVRGQEKGGLTKAAGWGGGRGEGRAGGGSAVSPCVLSSGLAEAGALFALEGPPVNSFLPGRPSIRGCLGMEGAGAGRGWPGCGGPRSVSLPGTPGAVGVMKTKTLTRAGMKCLLKALALGTSLLHPGWTMALGLLGYSP